MVGSWIPHSEIFLTPQDIAHMEVLALEFQSMLEGLTGCVFSPKHWTQMSHFPTHMPKQTTEMGPVSDTWMFCFESFFGALKALVHSRSQPIANICGQIQTNAALRLLRSCMDYQKFGGPIQGPVVVPDVPRAPGDGWIDDDVILKRHGAGGMPGEGRTRKLRGDLPDEILTWMKMLPEYLEIKDAWDVARRGLEPNRWRRLPRGEGGDEATRVACVTRHRLLPPIPHIFRILNQDMIST
jgi:hypothetical protein